MFDQSQEPSAPTGGNKNSVELRVSSSLALSIHVCAVTLGAAALYFAKDFFLPLALAALIALTLIPIVRRLQRYGVPAAASAVALVCLLAGVLGVGAYALSGPVLEWVRQAPSIGNRIESRFEKLRGSVEAVAQAGKQVEQIANATADPNTREVVLKEPGFLSTATSSLWQGITIVAITLLLVLFVLGSGDMLYEKLIRIIPTFRDKKVALRIVHEIESSISRYLLTVVLINSGLGLAIGIAMWALGMPNPALFGVAGACLNFLPYLGAIVGIAGTAVVAFISIEPLVYAALPPVAYFMLSTLEGNIITPLVLGRRLELNTVAIFVGVAFWGWIWGIVGVLLAVPLLVVLKVVCDHLPSWTTLGELLSQGGAKVSETAEEPNLNPATKA